MEPVGNFGGAMGGKSCQKQWRWRTTCRALPPLWLAGSLPPRSGASFVAAAGRVRTLVPGAWNHIIVQRCCNSAQTVVVVCVAFGSGEIMRGALVIALH